VPRLARFAAIQFKLQVYADGFAPTIQTFDEFKVANDVRMAYAVECPVQ